ncbi:hypothetical protein PoB_001297400 [Plakobranchus ocellatus]|uniref:Uncharacterized protein n=1 Tax=Plakobranchus ocellatus TaxID=259542 RepID=A0AAV3YXL9_9GAST|nr:hypothetical protein PoB_001297400 [Plakobranchus ocellatus]
MRGWFWGFLYIAGPQQGDLRLLGTPSDWGTDGEARTRGGRVLADLRADSQATVPPTAPSCLVLVCVFTLNKMASLMMSTVTVLAACVLLTSSVFASPSGLLSDRQNKLSDQIPVSFPFFGQQRLKNEKKMIWFLIPSLFSTLSKHWVDEVSRGNVEFYLL